jgi:hypothetical protein
MNTRQTWFRDTWYKWMFCNLWRQHDWSLLHSNCQDRFFKAYNFFLYQIYGTFWLQIWLIGFPVIIYPMFNLFCTVSCKLAILFINV